jgi:transposase
MEMVIGKQQAKDSEAIPRSRATAANMRRRFTPEYKLSVLLQAERAAALGWGALSRFLRKEGLYSSLLAQWRRQRKLGQLGNARRGRPGRTPEELRKENIRLRRSLAYLELCLRDAESLFKPLGVQATLFQAEPAGNVRQRIRDLAALAESATRNLLAKKPLGTRPAYQPALRE